MNNYRHLKLNIILLKTFGYRLCSFSIIAFLIYFYTKNISQALQISVLLELIKCIIYFLYECIFNKHFTVSQDEGFVLWATGCSGVGKTTLMDAVAKELKKYDRKVERLDGDIVRQSLCNDLGFSKKDRDSNIKRVTFVSKLLSKNGVGVLCSFISPYRTIRRYVRNNTTNFIELYLHASKKCLIKRDPKGLYKLAIEGKIKGLTGYDGKYEYSKKRQITINTEITSIKDSVNIIINYLKERKLI